jgi:gamma-glutamyltranspeptidase/glutathione hydrolase
MRDFHFPGRSPVLVSNGLCATSHPIAAQAAVSILQKGGNAMDAAIAGAVLLGLCEPAMTGIGGDCFALVSPSGGDDIIAINGSGRAPAGVDAAALRAKGHGAIAPRSADAVTIPGAMDAFCSMSETWGKLGLADSLAPAIHYMDQGVPVAPRIAADWSDNAETEPGAFRTHFMNNGKPFKQGDIFRLPGQAEVLRRVAAKGRSAFYEGEVADDMLAALNALGGAHTAQDFAATANTVSDPISGSYKNRELCEHPPNGQGATAILMLNILSQFDIAAMDPFGTQRAHIEAEASKLAYDTRNRFMADPEYMTKLDHMLSMDTAQKLAALIDPKRATAAVQPLTESVHKDTIYITVVDRDRMVVSLIYSIFQDFGSKIASEKFGILLQNRGAGFSLAEGHPNEMGPGKRPMHTIIPAMVRDQGRVSLPFGVMGGQYQSCGHARMMTNWTDFGMAPQDALDAPRCFDDGKTMQVERGYATSVRQELADMGHNVVVPERAIGGAQAILIHESGVLEGASDPRKDGCAIGY